jgi:SpoVK/Ycf46/Vps4 family AAA+-type ATPase
METVLNIIPRLVRASLDGDTRTVESSSLTLIRKLKKEYPDIANEIAKALSFNGVGVSMTRAIGLESPPTDRETLLSLAKVEEPDLLCPEVVLDEDVKVYIQEFIRERELVEKLISSGIRPPTSLILYGPPGVGKTYLTKYLSSKLKMPLINLDLAATISSYLGKTGQNLKKVLDYAKSKPTILFLDEFDAVAKRRDDPTDLGELKRIVNVLLKELEDWPSHSIVVAATNHADLLDKAIWRRFDGIIEIKLPTLTMREQLWRKFLGNVLPDIDNTFIKALAEVTEGLSGSDICRISNRILRQIILNEHDYIKVIINELKGQCGNNSGKFNQIFARATKKILGSNVTQSQIAEWLGISVSTVNHHLKKKEG